jgi:hypothetical protein
MAWKKLAFFYNPPGSKGIRKELDILQWVKEGAIARFVDFSDVTYPIFINLSEIEIEYV